MSPPPIGIPERRSGAATEALANSDRLARLIKVVSLLLALYVAVAVTAASVIGVQNSIRSNENAAEAKRLARQARDQARVNGNIAAQVAMLVKQQAPCLEGDPPDSPGCVRQARSDAVVESALRDIADEAHNQHQHLVNVVAGLVGKRAPILPRTAPRPASSPSATVAPRVGVSPAPSPAAPPPPTTAAPRPAPPPATTTTCPKRGSSEKCR